LSNGKRSQQVGSKGNRAPANKGFKQGDNVVRGAIKLRRRSGVTKAGYLNGKDY